MKQRVDCHGRWQLYFTYSGREGADMADGGSGRICEIEECYSRSLHGPCYRVWMLLEGDELELPIREIDEAITEWYAYIEEEEANEKAKSA